MGASSSGEKMKIMDYINARSMVVRFEDGTVREGVSYAEFKRGCVRKQKRKTRKEVSMGCSNSDKTVSKAGEKKQVTLSPRVVVEQNKTFLLRAKAYLISAKALMEESQNTFVPSIVLCKKSVISLLQGVTKSAEEDLWCLGKQLKKNIGISIDPRDLVWLNIFNLNQEEEWLQPTMEDATMAIEITEKIIRTVQLQSKGSCAE